MFCNRNLYSAQVNYTVWPLHTPHKSFTAALAALGCVVSRPATDAVKNGSQIADRFTISWFSGKQKRTRSQCFHISWKPLKPSPKLCVLFFAEKIDICLYFDLYSLQNFSLWGFKSSQRPKIPQCHPSFFQEFFRNLGSKKARYFGLFPACHTFSHANMVAAAGFEPTTFGLWARRAT